MIDVAVTPGADDPLDPDEPPDPDDDEPHATTMSPAATTVTAKTIHLSFGIRTSLLPAIDYTAVVCPVRGSCPPKPICTTVHGHFDTFEPERFKYYGSSAGGAPRRPERNTTEAAGCRTGPSWEVATTAKRGRPASASRDDVLQAVAEQYINGRRVDVTVVARRLGVSRATIYRWFGSREGLIGEVVAIELERLIAAKRQAVTRRGAVGLIEVLDATNRSLAKSTALRRLLEQEPTVAMRLLTASDGIVQPRAVACVEELIRAEAAAGTFEPLAEPGALAYAIVRLAEAFLYNDAAIGIRGDHRRLRDVQAALLGVPARAA